MGNLVTSSGEVACCSWIPLTAPSCRQKEKWLSTETCTTTQSFHVCVWMWKKCSGFYFFHIFNWPQNSAVKNGHTSHQGLVSSCIWADRPCEETAPEADRSHHLSLCCVLRFPCVIQTNVRRWTGALSSDRLLQTSPPPPPDTHDELSITFAYAAQKLHSAVVLFTENYFPPAWQRRREEWHTFCNKIYMDWIQGKWKFCQKWMRLI